MSTHGSHDAGTAAAPAGTRRQRSPTGTSAPTPTAWRRMLHLLDQPDLDALEAAAVPAIIRADAPLDLPAARSETETLAELRALAAKNRPLVQMIGLGYHDTITPRRDQAERAGEPGLVHRLHAVPAGDLAGPARGAAQLPDRRSPT